MSAGLAFKKWILINFGLGGLSIVVANMIWFDKEEIWYSVSDASCCNQEASIRRDNDDNQQNNNTIKCIKSNLHNYDYYTIVLSCDGQIHGNLWNSTNVRWDSLLIVDSHQRLMMTYHNFPPSWKMFRQWSLNILKRNQSKIM